MEAIDRFKPLDQVLQPDERWGYFGRSLEEQHALISKFVLHDGVPEHVRQHFENARNTYLYSWFSFRLLSVAMLMLHTAGESALKARACIEGVHKRKTLAGLFELAIERRWIVDANFRVVSRKPGEAALPQTDSQEYCRQLAEAFRNIRNAVAHGETILTSTFGDMLGTITDLINQLFPEKR